MPDLSGTRPDGQHQLEQLFAAHHGTVLAYALRRTVPPGDRAAAQDVAGRVFTLAWQRLDALPAQPLPWLLLTARHVLQEEQRANRRRTDREHRHGRDPALSPQHTPDPAVNITDAAAVREALARLNPKDRELVLLVAWDDLPLTVAAQVLRVRPAAARTRWRRARRRLAELLDHDPAATDPPPAAPIPAAPFSAAPAQDALDLGATR